MSDGNEVEIHITSKDDANLDKLGPKYRKQGEQLGKELGEGFEKSTKSQKRTMLPVAAENPIDAAWRAKVQTSLKDTAKNALNIPLTPETEGFHRELSRLLDQTSHTAHAEIPLDLKDAAAFKAQVETLAHALSAEVKVRVPVEADKPALKKMQDDVEKATEKVAQRTQNKFEALKFTALSAGLPAAALVGGLGVTAALLAPEAAILGLGVASLKGNAQVADSFGRLKQHVVTDTQQMAGVLAGPVSSAATQLGASFDRLKPQIQSTMAESGNSVENLVGIVTDFSENAMPGLVTAVKTSEPVLKGMRNFAGQAGAGMTDLFVNVSKGSTAAGQSMATFGGITRDLEGFVGSFLANLANGSTGILPKFAGTLHQAEDVVLSLSSHGMPALQGATSGALGVVSGGLGVVNAFASGLGTWTQPLGAAAGTLYATNSMMKLFGTSLGETGFGIGAFAKTVQDGDQRISPFKASLQDAEKNGTSKLKAGANALVSSGLNPLGIALTAGSFILSAFGDAQQRASQQAAEHKENVRSLTDAIRADNGVLGDHVAAVNAQALVSKNAQANLSVFSGTMGEAKLAINGNTVAYQALLNKGGEALAQTMAGTGATKDQITAYSGLAKQALETGQSYDQLTKGVGASVFAYDAEGNAVDLATDAQKQHGSAIINGLGAIGEQINAQKQAHDEYLQAEHALTGLTNAQIENRDATIKATQAIYDQQNASLGLRGAQLNTKSAIEEYDKTLKDGKASADDKATSLLKVEQAFANQEAAAYKAAFADNANKTSGEQLSAALLAQDQTLVQLANSFSGTLPQSVQQSIGKMSLAQAQAAGLTVAIDDTGNAVYRLPDGKFVAITSSAAQEAARVENLKAQIAALHDKEVSIVVKTYGNVAKVGTSLTGPWGALAKGGLVGYASGGTVRSVPRYAGGGGAVGVDVTGGGLLRGPGTGTSDSILMSTSQGTVRGSNKEFVVKASQTAKNLPLLQAINNGAAGFANGGLVKYGDVSQSEWDGLYASGWRGNPNDGMEALYAPTRRQSAQPAGSSGSSEIRLVVNAAGSGDFERMLAELIRRYVKVNGGGSVQNAYGQR